MTRDVILLILGVRYPADIVTRQPALINRIGYPGQFTGPRFIPIERFQRMESA